MGNVMCLFHMYTYCRVTCTVHDVESNTVMQMDVGVPVWVSCHLFGAELTLWQGLVPIFVSCTYICFSIFVVDSFSSFTAMMWFENAP